MVKHQISFSPPDIGEKEIEYVTEVLKSGWITTGPKTKELEGKLSDFIGTGRVVCLNSATAALELALRLLGTGPGDEVITSAYTYTASASVIAHTGAKIVFADTLPDSIGIDPEMIGQLITPRTKAVIAVDVGGVPCDYDRIFEAIERKKDLFVPESPLQAVIGRVAVIGDSAHALGAYVSDSSGEKRMLGNVADFTAFSFHAVKNFTTAEGGALTWRPFSGVDDDEIYRKLQLYSLHGQSKDAFSKEKNGSWEYDIEGLWYKLNMTDIMAAIGLAQLERYPGMLKRREEMIAHYNEELLPLGIQVLPHYTDRHHSSGHLYAVRIPGIGEEERGRIIIEMAERGVACNVHFKPLPLMSAYKALGFDIKDYPNAYDYYRNEITLPLYTKLTDEEQDYVIECFKEVLKKFL